MKMDLEKNILEILNENSLSRLYGQKIYRYMLSVSSRPEDNNKNKERQVCLAWLFGSLRDKFKVGDPIFFNINISCAKYRNKNVRKFWQEAEKNNLLFSGFNEQAAKGNNLSFNITEFSYFKLYVFFSMFRHPVENLNSCALFHELIKIGCDFHYSFLLSCAHHLNDGHNFLPTNFLLFPRPNKIYGSVGLRKNVYYLKSSKINRSHYNAMIKMSNGEFGDERLIKNINGHKHDWRAISTFEKLAKSETKTPMSVVDNLELNNSPYLMELKKSLNGKEELVV